MIMAEFNWKSLSLCQWAKIKSKHYQMFSLALLQPQKCNMIKSAVLIRGSSVMSFGWA